MREQKFEIQIYDDLEELSQAAAQHFARLAEDCVASKGSFTVALSGGSTPKALFSHLAAAPLKDRLPWSKMHWFWGDERCVRPDHPDSNYRMANETLLTKVAIPDENVHRMPAEKESPEQAAVAYEQILKRHFRLQEKELPRFDLILLGMGEDGHTASLFPGTAAVHETARWVVAVHVAHLKIPDRLTLVPPVINHAANVIFLATGAGKAEVLKKVLEGEYQPHHLPSQIVQPTDGRLLWMLDSAAAKWLTHSIGRT